MFAGFGCIPDVTPYRQHWFAETLSSAILPVGAGAPVPQGADAVVQIENTQQLSDSRNGEKRIKINKVTAWSSAQRTPCD